LRKAAKAATDIGRKEGRIAGRQEERLRRKGRKHDNKQGGPVKQTDKRPKDRRESWLDKKQADKKRVQGGGDLISVWQGRVVKAIKAIHSLSYFVWERGREGGREEAKKRTEGGNGRV
jgi:hypothetical protein